MSEMADASEADDEYTSETDFADPCHSDYDYNYDTVDEDESPITIDVDGGARNYKELLMFEEMYKYEERQSAKRDEFIYTKVFNNYNIGIEVLVDFNLGTIDDWSKTCGKFNSGAMTLAFATLHIIIYNNGPYNCVALKCDNIHPFAEMNKQQDEIERLSNMLCANVIHD